MFRVIAAIPIFILLLAVSAFAVELHMLPVGDAGNQSDTRPNHQLGAVPYTYYLDKYDVTNSQYVEFLNAKSAISDPYSLFDLRMSTTVYGGITRTATAPFTYATKPGMANKPVIYVTWYDALRFTNWLTNGQGNGDTETGSYLLDANAGVVTVPTAAQRAVWAATSKHYLLPNMNEWYKAAYYKGGGSNAGYWNNLFATDDPPKFGPPGTLHGANYTSIGGNPAIPDPVALTDVGAYNNPGPYGQMDMGGNVAQYTDSIQFAGVVESRGGSWNSNSLQIESRASVEFAFPYVGFRLMMVPEPSTLALALGALGLLIAARRRR